MIVRISKAAIIVTYLLWSSLPVPVSRHATFSCPELRLSVPPGTLSVPKLLLDFVRARFGRFRNINCITILEMWTGVLD